MRGDVIGAASSLFLGIYWAAHYVGYDGHNVSILACVAVALLTIGLFAAFFFEVLLIVRQEIERAQSRRVNVTQHTHHYYGGGR